MGVLNPLTVPRGDYRYLRKMQDVACLATDTVGSLVCIRDVKTNNGKWRVQRSDNRDRAKLPAIGILIEKKTPTTGTIQIFGEIGFFSGLEIGKKYFVGESGTLLDTLPVPLSDQKIYVQKFGFPVASDVLFLTGDIGEIYCLIG